MPDIDIDFDDRGRSKVIDYVVQKYGRESVCQIITFGTMGARSVIRDVSRVMGIPLPEADRIAKLIPEGPKVSLDSAIGDVPEFRKLLEDPREEIRNMIHYARVLEGSARHTGVHAAGVIIAPGKVSDYVPVSIARGKGGADDVLTTQYDGKWVESFGLLKMDFLGLKTLTVLTDALALIKENYGVEIDLETIPLDDEETFKLFQDARTIAIFQFESSGMREWLRKLKPTAIDDLIAMNALYRPGPMDNIPSYIARKHGEEEVEHLHPMLEPILKPTYGIPVYQEQVMQMAQVMGGYTLGRADLLRRAMGKKKKSEMVKQRSIFVEGAQQRGVDVSTADEVFDLMAKFAGYGFNKSHSAAYSIIAYQTAYLKTHYPAEFMAAAMTSDMGDSRKLATVLDDARQFNIELLPPSINISDARFTVDKGAIRFGLGAIKGLGTGAIEVLVNERTSSGAFSSLFDLTMRIDSRQVNKKAIECLAKAGALDELEGHRAQLVEAVDRAVQYGQKVQADRAAGQNSLFGAGGDGAATMEPGLPVVDPWPRSRMLKEERDSVGFYVSGHPLEAYLPEIRAFASARISDAEKLLAELPEQDDRNGYRGDKPQHSFCGIITEVQRRVNKSGRPYAFARFEDFSGQAELICFSNTYDRVQQYLVIDEIVLIRGSIDQRGGSLKVLANEILPMWKVRTKLVKSLIVRIDADSLSQSQVDKLEALFNGNKGGCKLYFDMLSRSAPHPQRLLSRSFVVDPTTEVMTGLTRLFGRHAVVVEGEK
jgi:DNA polymerase III subunit alpha